MIKNIEVGHAYHIVGKAVWAEWESDVYVIGNIDPSQIDLLGINLYDIWFSPYSLTEKLYTQTMANIKGIIRCKAIASRDPAVDVSDAEDIFLFPELVDFGESEELFKASSYIWTLTTKPYLEDDENNPQDSVKAIEDAITDSVKDVIYDSFSMYNSSAQYWIPESEYNLIASNRNDRKDLYRSKLQTQKASDANTRAYMVAQINEAARIKQEYSAKSVALDKMVAAMGITRASLDSSSNEYNAKLEKLQSIYAQFLTYVANYNNKVLASERVNAPTWEDLLSSGDL